MITGVVTANHQAIIALTLHDSAGQPEVTEALLDTGFNGFLTLPLLQIARLQFPYEGTMRVVLGDGQAVDLDMFIGTVLWDGQFREGIVLAAEGSALVGMALLMGSRVTLEVEDGGLVTIDRLP